MKKIVTTKYVSGCVCNQSANCPKVHLLPNGNWYCMNSNKNIALFTSPMSNAAQHLNTIPEWCELEDN